MKFFETNLIKKIKRGGQKCKKILNQVGNWFVENYFLRFFKFLPGIFKYKVFFSFLVSNYFESKKYQST